MTEDDALANVLRALRRDYLRDAPDRIGELEALHARLSAGDAEALDALRRALHKLAGSGGSYGLDAVSRHSRAGERLAQRILDEGAVATLEQLREIGAAIHAVADAFRQASAADT